LPVPNGLKSLDKVLKIKVIELYGNSILMDFGKICNLDNLMLLRGINIMDCGQDKLLLFLLHIPDGSIWLLTPFHFTVLFQDFKVNSQGKLQHGQMNGRVLITIGFMKIQILIDPGCYLKECGDG